MGYWRTKSFYNERGSDYVISKTGGIRDDSMGTLFKSGKVNK